MSKPIAILDEKTAFKWGEEIDIHFPEVTIRAVTDKGTYRADSIGTYPRTIPFKHPYFYELPKPGLFSRNKPINCKMYYFAEFFKTYTLEVVEAKNRLTGKTVFKAFFSGIKLNISPYEVPKFEKFLKDIGVTIKPGVLFTEEDCDTLVSSLVGYIANDLYEARYLATADFTNGDVFVPTRKELMKVAYDKASRLNKFRDELLKRLEDSLSNMGFTMDKTVN